MRAVRAVHRLTERDITRDNQDLLAAVGLLS
jgi:hypothetical protein